MNAFNFRSARKWALIFAGGQAQETLWKRRVALAALVLLSLLALAAGWGWNSEQAKGVQLVLSTEQLQPNTTFELRFDEPMARSGRPGAAEEVSPLVFKPKLAGQFVWTSPRSGVFTPTEPLVLDTAYALTLQPGLNRADGQPATARLRGVLRTPPFGAVRPQQEASTNAGSEPEIRLWFNADVKAADVAARARFVNKQGKRVAAAVRQGVIGETGWRWRQDTERTWRGLFEQYHADDRQREPMPDSTDAQATNPAPNLVVITPAQPLSIGQGWRLVVNAGVPSADGKLRSKEPVEAQVGDVQEFLFSTAVMHHTIYHEPALELDFSKALDRSLTNSFTNWVRISPWPVDLAATVSGGELWLRGGWQRDQPYQVTLLHGLPAREAFVLSKLVNLTTVVPPVDPRLYFPEFSTEQFAGGNRSFPLLAVNAGRVSVKAKLVDAATAIHALRGFSSYFLDAKGIYRGGFSFWRYDGFHRLDYNLIPGRTVFSNEYDFLGKENDDKINEVRLGWDQVLDGRKAGVVFLQAERAGPAEDPALGTQALIQLTDLGLVWKSGGGQFRAFVFSYTTGQPVNNAQVRLYTEENQVLAEAATDSAGLAQMPCPTNAVWVAAQAGDDLHAMSLGTKNIPTWPYGTSWRMDEERETRRAVLFTDRDAYRPGETVNFKAILRDLEESRLGIPAGRTGLVVCADSRDRQFFRTNLTLSALGSCAAAIPLPTGARGSYMLTLKLDGQDFYKSIQVADFEPAAFEIQLAPKPAYGPDEKFEVPLSARYFFGKSLSRAQVHWSVEAEDEPLRPEGFDDFTFARSWLESQWGRQHGSFALTGTERLESGSNCVLRFELPTNPQAPQPRVGSLLVEVTDLNQQTLTRSARLVKHSSDFYLGMKQFDRVLEPGKPLPVELAVVGADGKPWREAVSAKLRLRRVLWQSIEVQGAGRSIRYHNEATLTNVLARQVSIAPPVKLANGERGFRGSPVESLAVPSGGEYLLEVTATDAAGHEVASSLDFDVLDSTGLAWNYRNDVELKLEADKPSYHPGETAVLLVKAPFSGAAWVTVEREKVMRSFLTRLGGNTPAVRVPIEAADAPNVFVSVTLVRGAADSPHKVREPEYRVGYCELKVQSPARTLQVEPGCDKTNYLPGQTVTVDARIRDAAGAPVANAEVTLYAVDEGVLSLTEYSVPNLCGTFLSPRSLGVVAGISLPLLMPEDPEQLSFHNKGYMGGDGGGRAEHLRKRFLPCPFWNASLMTDAEGRVSAAFTAPDSLTRYKVIAVAHTAQSQFGSGTTAFTISKPLIIEPALPQFANITDHLQARALIQNQTDIAGPVLVTLQLDDKAQAGTDLSQTVQVTAHGSAIVEFPLTLTATGPAKWVWRARFANQSATTDPQSPVAFTDSVQSALPIGNVTPLLHEVLTVRLGSLPQSDTRRQVAGAPSETNLLRAANPQLLTGKGTISVTVANTRLVGLREAIQQLLHYPYGCVEQTSSSLLPWIVLRDTPALLVLTQRDGADATAAAQAGIARLFSMQTSSGGLSYWPGGKEPMLWGSAYGGFVLVSARKAGLPVPQKEFEALLNYLSGQLRARGETDSYAQCLALYVLALAGKPEPAYHTRFYENRAHLDAEQRALLALAILTGETGGSAGGGRRSVGSVGASERGNASAVAMARELLLSNDSAKPAPRDPFGCLAREKAVQLLAWSTYAPGERQAEACYRELETGAKQGHWGTTQGNAWALLAMREYLRQTESDVGPCSGTLTWGEQKKSFDLGADCGVFSDSLLFDSTMADRPLVLSSPSGKALYAQVAIESRLPVMNSARQDHGLGLTRRYEKLNDNNLPEPFERLRVGDRVLVTLRLSVPEPAQYVAIDDSLPGVFEALNSEFKTQQVPGAAQRALSTQNEGRYWWNSFQEIRADRVLFFSDEVAPGNYVIRYVARVRAAGAVTAPVAKAEEMYHPERFGLTEPQAVVSEALE